MQRFMIFKEILLLFFFLSSWAFVVWGRLVCVLCRCMGGKNQKKDGCRWKVWRKKRPTFLRNNNPCTTTYNGAHTSACIIIIWSDAALKKKKKTRKALQTQSQYLFFSPLDLTKKYNHNYSAVFIIIFFSKFELSFYSSYIFFDVCI